MWQFKRWRPGFSHTTIGLLGLVVGQWLTGGAPRTIHAVSLGSQAPDGSSLLSGPVSLQYNEKTKVQANLDALYFLDYRAGKLYATVPEQKATVLSKTLISSFVERDLVADFKLDVNQTASPHFLMSTGAQGAYGDGSSPLYVFETNSRQVAVYRLTTMSIGMISRPKFELLELKSILALSQTPLNLPGAGDGSSLPALPK